MGWRCVGVCSNCNRTECLNDIERKREEEQRRKEEEEKKQKEKEEESEK